MTEARIVYGTVVDIMAERDRGLEKWGGPEHDDQHDLLDWLDILETLKAEVIMSANTIEETRPAMLKFVAVAIAMAESFDRITATGPHLD